MRHVSLLVMGATVVVWLAVAWLASGLIGRWLAQSLTEPPPAMPAATSAAGQAAGALADSALRPLARAFGAPDAAAAGWALSDIVLVGFIHAEADSVVALRFKNGPTQRLRLNQTSPEGIRFDSVQEGQVVLRGHGQEFRITATAQRANLFAR
jgi:hypothetical protein